MAYCPNCAAEVEANAKSCQECAAIFGEEGGWNPVNEKPRAAPGRFARVQAKPVKDEPVPSAAKPASTVGCITTFLILLLGTVLVLGLAPLVVIALVREFGTKSAGTEYGLIGAVLLAGYALVFAGIPLAIVILVSKIFSGSAGPMDSNPAEKSAGRLDKAEDSTPGGEGKSDKQYRP